MFTKYISVYVYRLLCKQMGEMLRVQKDHINSNERRRTLRIDFLFYLG